MKITTDYLIIGSGIMGLALARSIILAQPKSSITIIDKENDLAIDTVFVKNPDIQNPFQ